MFNLEKLDIMSGDYSKNELDCNLEVNYIGVNLDSDRPRENVGCQGYHVMQDRAKRTMFHHDLGNDA